jgi:penicillin-binding protein A
MLNPTNRAAVRANISRAGRCFLLLSVIVSLALPYWIIIRGPSLLARPENARPLEEEGRSLRGRIIDANGVVLAHSEMQSDGYVKRMYSTPALAHVTGYWSLRYGTSGIEAARNSALRGSSGATSGEQALNTLLHRPTTGNDVVVTIDTRVQKAADEALGQARGAIVVLDVRTGAVIALASHPYSDPNQVSDQMPLLKDDAGRPLFNRALMGLYPPGSTFKTVTLATGLETKTVSPVTTYSYALNPPNAQHPAWWHTGGQGYLCQNHASNNSPFDLTGAYIWSCNVAFGDMSLALGADAIREGSRQFGFGRPIPFDLPTAVSLLYVTPDYLTGAERSYALASTGFGQGQVIATPLQMALVAAAVANDGKVAAPYLVARVQSPAGRTLEVAQPHVMSTAMSSQTAATIRQMMIASVDSGWAHTAAISGVKIGGKTGTAETGVQETPNSWFIGFAPGDSPHFALAVLIEGGGYGSAYAAPIGKKVLEALLDLK